VALPRRQTLLLVAAFFLAIAATFFFGYRAGRTAREIRRHNDRQRNEPIRAWMSVPFVAHTYHIPEPVLFQAIHVPPNPRDHRPIRDIARAEKLPSAELIRELEKAVASADNGGKAP
jgi:hypothetical protein